MAIISNSFAQRDSIDTHDSPFSSRETKQLQIINMSVKILSVLAHNSSHIWWTRMKEQQLNQAHILTSSLILWLGKMTLQAQIKFQQMFQMVLR